MVKQDLGTFTGAKSSSITSSWHFENSARRYFATKNFPHVWTKRYLAAFWAVRPHGNYRKDVISYLIVGEVKQIEEYY